VTGGTLACPGSLCQVKHLTGANLGLPHRLVRSWQHLDAWSSSRPCGRAPVGGGSRAAGPGVEKGAWFAIYVDLVHNTLDLGVGRYAGRGIAPICWGL
jgi:hypothetical protein